MAGRKQTHGLPDAPDDTQEVESGQYISLDTSAVKSCISLARNIRIANTLEEMNAASTAALSVPRHPWHLMHGHVFVLAAAISKARLLDRVFLSRQAYKTANRSNSLHSSISASLAGVRIHIFTLSNFTQLRCEHILFLNLPPPLEESSGLIQHTLSD